MSNEAKLARLDARFPLKRAVITGGASGLGLATAEWLARRGWRIALLDRDAARLGEAIGALTALGAVEVSTHVVDVGDDLSVRQAIDQFAGAHGGLDFALNAAGVAVFAPFLDTPQQDWEWILRINVLGVASSCRAELPHMLAAGGGLIVNVASAASFVCGADMSAYSVSKSGVVALSESLDQEHREKGVQVTAAMPGFFRTRLLEHARAPDDMMATAKKIMHKSNLEAAPVALEVLVRAAAGERHVVLPREYRFLWRYKRFSPGAFQRFMVRFQQKRAAAARARRGG
jgi:NAD(P)-dependent dehydrogenase (short-subunit alcohol dehydrogenase family)